MKLLNIIFFYLNLIGLAILITEVLILAVLFYLLRVKKIAAKKENIDTSKFRKKDSIGYISFEDIVSGDGKLDSEGMIVINKHVFVGGISVRGFDYASSSTDDRIAAQVNAVNFFNVVEKPTSFRQSIRGVDLSENISEYTSTLKKIGTDMMELDMDYQATLNASEEYLDDPESYGYYAKRLEELQRMIAAKAHMKEECMVVLDYMNAMSEDSGKANGTAGRRENQIMFSYVFNPQDYSQELSKEEIYTKAMGELNIIAKSYSNALAACNFSSKRLSARELIRLMKKHTSPITGDMLNLDELLDSSYTNLFVSSDSLVNTIKEKISEEIYEQRVREYEEHLHAILDEQEKARMVAGEALISKSYETAIHGMEKELEV